MPGGPVSLRSPNRQTGYDECANQDLRSCLVALGLTDEAVRFAMAVTHPDQIGIALASKFRELGPVDLATVNASIPPYETYHFLNGSPDIRSAFIHHQYLRVVFKDRTSRTLLGRYPNAQDWNSRIVAHRLLPNGRQRFVRVNWITESCHACPVMGMAIQFLDFHPGGSHAATTSVGIMDWRRREVFYEPTANDIARDARLLQYRLNVLGYDAGPMDGVPGVENASGDERVQDRALPAGSRCRRLRCDRQPGAVRPV